MTEILERNREYAAAMKNILRLRGEPVAIKLVAEGDEYPAGYQEPNTQMSHCQAVFRARDGESFKLPLESQNCMIGCSTLGMIETPEKIASGEFHASTGMYDTPEAAARMVAVRAIVPSKNRGEVVCPLKDADFVPDVVTIEDIPERIYWIVPLATAKRGGRIQFSMSSFQGACEDIVSVPICTGKPNISMGCFVCRKKTTMASDEMAVGIPYIMIPEFVERLRRYETGVMAKAKRD